MYSALWVVLGTQEKLSECQLLLWFSEMSVVPLSPGLEQPGEGTDVVCSGLWGGRSLYGTLRYLYMGTEGCAHTLWSGSTPSGLCFCFGSPSGRDRKMGRGGVPCPRDVSEEQIRAAMMGVPECWDLPKSKATSILTNVAYVYVARPTEIHLINSEFCGGTLHPCSGTLFHYT